MGGGDSRGQVLHIDESNMTASLTLNVDVGSYSAFVGSAQRLLNGNYVFDSGGVVPNIDTQVTEWTISGAEVSNSHEPGVTYRAVRARDLYSTPF
jgi:hypothetical protein